MMVMKFDWNSVFHASSAFSMLMHNFFFSPQKATLKPYLQLRLESIVSAHVLAIFLSTDTAPNTKL